MKTSWEDKKSLPDNELKTRARSGDSEALTALLAKRTELEARINLAERSNQMAISRLTRKNEEMDQRELDETNKKIDHLVKELNLDEETARMARGEDNE